MLRLSTILIAALLIGRILNSAEYYVSANAASTGNGSMANPWTLQTSLLTPPALRPGDTVFVRGGVYQGLFTAAISGMPTAPITFRNAKGESSVLDGQLNLGNSSNVWIWGLEFIDSNKTNRPSPFNTISGGTGLGTKIINCLIHDCCIGISPPGVYEAYGNVMWNCGKSTTEHPIYWQNNGVAPKYLENNLIGYSSGFGIHCYGSAGELKSLRIIGNAVWGQSKAAILLGGSQPIVDGIIAANHAFCRSERALQLGYAASNTSVSVESNYLFAPQPFRLNNPFQKLILRNNILGGMNSACIVSPLDNLPAGSYSWNANDYYFGTAQWSSWTNTFALFGNAYLGFEQWKLETGLDTESSHVRASPPDRVIIQPNRYEAKRAHIIAWNWTAADNIAADVSQLLSVGDAYEIRSALNYFAGPVKVGTYTGGSIQIPITNLTVAPTLYWSPTSQPYNPSPNFAAFILTGSESGSHSPKLLAPEELRVTSPQ